MEKENKQEFGTGSSLKYFLRQSKFWSDLKFTKDFIRENGDPKPYEEILQTCRQFDSLRQNLKPWMKTKEGAAYSRNLLTIKAGLLLNKDKDTEKIFNQVFHHSFEAFKVCNKELFECGDQTSDDEDDDEANTCSGCHYENEQDCKCLSILDTVTRLNGILSDLDLIEEVVNHAIVTSIYEQLTGFLENHCKGEYMVSSLQNIFTWMEQGLMAWLQFILSGLGNPVEKHSGMLTIDEWKMRLEYFVYKAFAELRISELFEMIVDYPDSSPALSDLKECLNKTETRGLLTKSLKSAFERRLLHPAVNTDDILTQYVSTIRALRELDPSGIILENVCIPLREYLRSRDDTIKCIITCLTDQGPGPDLSEELLRLGDDHGGENKTCEIDSDGEDWFPDPVDAVQSVDTATKSQRTADIINILVNIYGSQDMFVSQYRILLADRILNNFSYDVTNERRYVELLKRRFGENHLHYCDIMLKDIQDSHRINRHIKTEISKKGMEPKKPLDDGEKIDAVSTEEEGGGNKVDIDFNAFILSSAFWPSLSNETIEPPAQVDGLMTEYNELFKQSKGMRQLEWLTNLGSVEIEVELDEGGTKTFNVTPAQATLLVKFHEKDGWTINDLATELNTSKASLRNRIAFWVGQGVIIEKANGSLISAQNFQSNAMNNSIYESDDESGAFSSQNQKDEELQVYWSYVVGMLTNIGSLPLDRIHSMLKMFANSEANSQCTVEDVKSFLQAKVANGELAYVGGVYKLPKPS